MGRTWLLRMISGHEERQRSLVFTCEHAACTDHSLNPTVDVCSLGNIYGALSSELFLRVYHNPVCRLRAVRNNKDLYVRGNGCKTRDSRIQVRSCRLGNLEGP